jgi:hypothetical protein
MTSSKTELAWAAGFFDGEGNANASGGTFALRMPQIHPEVLERFRSAVGLGKVYGPYPATQPNRQPQWRYEVAGLSAKIAYEQIRPYLGSVKKEQADKALAHYTATVHRHVLPPHVRVEIQQAYQQHTDPLIGKRKRGGKIFSKEISFRNAFATRWGISPSGLYQLVHKLEKENVCRSE